MTDTSKPLFPIDEHLAAVLEIGKRYTARYVAASGVRSHGRVFDSTLGMLASLVRRSLDGTRPPHRRHSLLLSARAFERDVKAERFDAIERRDVDRVVLALDFAEACLTSDLERLHDLGRI